MHLLPQFRRRRILLLLALLLAGLIGGGLFATRETGYQGKSVSAWVAQLRITQLGQTNATSMCLWTSARIRFRRWWPN
jgi:hypothetical protein